MKWLNIAAINTWWVRLMVLLLIGIPAFSGFPLRDLIIGMKVIVPLYLDKVGEISSIVSWVLYACLVWLAVFSSVGARKFLEYLAGAFVIGLTTAILGSAMRKVFPFIAGSLTGDEISLKMLKLLLIIISVVPYALLFVNSFSAKNMLSRLAEAKGKRKEVGLHLALLLRIFQHTGEVVFNLVEIWTEEHPIKIIPRHRRDWHTKWYSIANIFPWAWSAILAWIYATMIHTFEPIPGMVAEVEKINQYRR
jgi:hypothetical protein